MILMKNIINIYIFGSEERTYIKYGKHLMLLIV